MNIRQATVQDAPGICDVWNPLIETTATTFTVDLKTPEIIAATIEARKGAFFVALDTSQVIGFATYFPFRGGPGYRHTKEHSINLSPLAAGKGVGRQLMQSLERHAFESGVHSLWAGISSENPAGVAFHARIGFTHIARLPEVGFKFERWMDLILMQKILRE